MKKKRGYRGPLTTAPLPRNEAHRSITTEEAERAIYIDFQKTVKGPPALLGVQVESNLQQIVLDPRLAGAARASGLEQGNVETILHRLIRWAEDQGRPLVAFSQFERDVIHQCIGRDVSDLYRDARMIAVRWKKACEPKAKLEDRGLKSFLKLIDYPRRRYLGELKAAKWIRVVQEALEKQQGDFEKLTAVQKSFWTKLLEHNQVDCDGMRELVVTAAQRFAERAEKGTSSAM